MNVVADVMWKISFHAVDFPLLSYWPVISISLPREVTSNGVQPWSLKSAHQIPRIFFAFAVPPNCGVIGQFLPTLPWLRETPR